MKVRYSYLSEQFENPEPIFDDIRELLTTGDFTLGKKVKEFEEKFAKLIGTKFAIGVGSGTDALKLSLKAIGVGPGDEVITAANTFIATAGAINEIGATPVFVDSNQWYVMDVAKVREKISPKTKAIMPVHFTGEPVDMDQLMYISKHYQIPIVEDACQSILAKWDNQNCGTFGVAAGYSLHPLKNLNVWADGGVIVTNDEKIEKKLRLLRNHGLKTRDEISMFGYNSRLDTIQAIVGLHLIDQAESITNKRRANAKYYDENLRDVVMVTPFRPKTASCYHLYMFQVMPVHREALLTHLLNSGIEAKVHYPIPLYRQEGLKHLGYKKGDFPLSDEQAEQVISLPVDQHLTKEQMDYCIEKVKDYFKGVRSW
jgi:aminotransferase EvaB